MKKTRITICTGTACYVLGGANLLELEDFLSDEMKSRIEITGSACLGMCKAASNDSKPPYVKIDDEVIHSATIQKIIAYLSER
ncbi:MAG TPA: NAD(P)H-dependent oxidoreductase subunit E [Spirochaetota bacterium]|jgi:NADH:ubiquinone oxidoreductase subunit E|nr:NAD(P)H-dependent oxidoreductase subunit E [Spirochaetota bacterium]HQO21498.1 NAD(P)H-dependent oxidoreductase subunit E [Spirochaetota bacterium]HQQ22655.1 NAD(P)H-dependent oxidoreductase subunit E [Spirochaetota bacterium]